MKIIFSWQLYARNLTTISARLCNLEVLFPVVVKGRFVCTNVLGKVRRTSVSSRRWRIRAQQRPSYILVFSTKLVFYAVSNICGDDGMNLEPQEKLFWLLDLDVRNDQQPPFPRSAQFSTVDRSFMPSTRS